jgi:acetylornithine/N-succinyldiaminopimelate aminotransferase
MLFPTYRRYDIRAAKGEGAYLWDEAGNRWLDFTSGLAVCNLGHCHPRVTEAVQKQLETLWHVSNLFHIPLQEEVAGILTEASGLGAVFFCNSGAEANEAAIKLARKAAREKRGIERPHIITFQGSFHGRTLATLTATGQEKVKTGFAPLPEGFVTVSFGDLDAVKQAVDEKTAAVTLELVQGEGGVRPADPAFVAELYRFCREREILFMVDEVQTGMGRTGALFAFERYGVTPDVVTLAKGLGNGIPVGAMMARSELAPVFGPGSHASTFGGNPLAMAAARAVLQEVRRPELLENVRKQGERLLVSLREKLDGHPSVKAIRGLGLMVGIELTDEAAPVIDRAREQGLLVLPAGPRVVRLLPPLIVTEEMIDRAVKILADSVTAMEVAGR